MATITKLCRCSPGLQKFVQTVEQGKTTIKLGPIFGLDDIVEAHRCIEENRAQCKIVVVP